MARVVLFLANARLIGLDAPTFPTLGSRADLTR
jgi:hypothetical protein